VPCESVVNLRKRPLLRVEEMSVGPFVPEYLPSKGLVTSCPSYMYKKSWSFCVEKEVNDRVVTDAKGGKNTQVRSRLLV
jgi:hypothetical protein